MHWPRDWNALPATHGRRVPDDMRIRPAALPRLPQEQPCFSPLQTRASTATSSARCRVANRVRACLEESAGSAIDHALSGLMSTSDPHRRCAPPYAPHPCGAPCGPPAAFAAAPAAAVSHGEKGRAQGRREALPSPVGEGLGVRVRVPASCLMAPMTCRNARLTVKKDAPDQSRISRLTRAERDRG